MITHGDFYRWLKLERDGSSYRCYWREWTPELWDPDGSSFDRHYSYGYGDFLDAMYGDGPVSIWELIKEFLDTVPVTRVSDFVEEVKSEAVRFFQLGWRKCVLAGRISQDDEAGLIELFRFIRTWQGVQGRIGIFSVHNSDTPRVEDLPLELVPDHIPGIASRRYWPGDGWRYDIPKLLQGRFGYHFWVQFDNPEKIKAPLVKFMDGVIMAIPVEMIPSEFQELAAKTESYLGLIKTEV